MNIIERVKEVVQNKDQQPDWEEVRNLFIYNREYAQLGASQVIVTIIFLLFSGVHSSLH